MPPSLFTPSDYLPDLSNSPLTNIMENLPVENSWEWKIGTWYATKQGVRWQLCSVPQVWRDEFKYHLVGVGLNRLNVNHAGKPEFGWEGHEIVGYAENQDDRKFLQSPLTNQKPPMKSQLELPDVMVENKDESQAFPLLAKLKDDDYVIFFASENCGVVLHEGTHAGRFYNKLGNVYRNIVLNKDDWEILPPGTKLTLTV